MLLLGEKPALEAHRCDLTRQKMLHERYAGNVTGLLPAKAWLRSQVRGCR